MQRQSVKQISIISSIIHQIWIKSYLALVRHDVINENETAKPDDPWSLQVEKTDDEHFIGLNMITKKTLTPLFDMNAFPLVDFLDISCFTHITTRVFESLDILEWVLRRGLQQIGLAGEFGLKHAGIKCTCLGIEISITPQLGEELPENDNWTWVNFHWG